jgi:hypothetical protein
MRALMLFSISISILLTFVVCPKAYCQAFLEPVAREAAPSFLEGSAPAAGLPGTTGEFPATSFGPAASTPAFVVTPPALPVITAQLPATGLGVAVTTAGLLAPASVNQSEEIPTIPGMRYGFGPGHGLEANPNPTQNGYGAYGGYVLPTVSTGAININTVDCPFIGRPEGWYHDGWVHIPGRGWRNLQESATQFIDTLNNPIGNLPVNMAPLDLTMSPNGGLE